MKRWPFHASANMTSIDPIQLSGDLSSLLTKAWFEIEHDIPQVPPSEGTVAKFCPSRTCKFLIDWVHGEVCQLYGPLYSYAYEIFVFSLGHERQNNEGSILKILGIYLFSRAFNYWAERRRHSLGNHSIAYYWKSWDWGINHTMRLILYNSPKKRAKGLGTR